jgi:hypothetical protein
MKINFIIYYVVLTTACLLSVIRIKHDRRLLVFSAMLICSLAEELLFEFLEDSHICQNCFFIYHIYLPIYYCLFAFYFSLTIPTGKIRTLMRLSIPFFAILTLALSLSHGNFKNFPGVQLDIMSVLLIINSIIVLFLLDATDITPLYRRPVFWIAASTMIFYTVLFLLNGFFDYLFNNDKDLARDLNKFLNNNINYLYYLLIIIGMICSKPRKRYSSQSC